MNMRYIIFKSWGFYLELVMQNMDESLWYPQLDLSNSQKHTVKASLYSLLIYISLTSTIQASKYI